MYVQDNYEERGKSMLHLTRRLAAHIPIASPAQPGDTDVTVDTGVTGREGPETAPPTSNLHHIGNTEGFQHLQSLLREANQLCDEKNAFSNRTFKAQLGRRWTHNEQLIVRPCGIIIARATFFGAEAVSSVAVCMYPHIWHAK
jgi:hypothetical protein